MLLMFNAFETPHSAGEKPKCQVNPRSA